MAAILDRWLAGQELPMTSVRRAASTDFGGDGLEVVDLEDPLDLHEQAICVAVVRTAAFGSATRVNHIILDARQMGVRLREVEANAMVTRCC